MKRERLSLHPLTPEEAIGDLLKVTPPPKAEKPQAKKVSRKRGKKPKK